ncbi:HMG-box, partial [Auriscalpium vulgare]
KAQAEDDVDDGGKKKRSARKLKDPNAPKRPASSYIFFQNEQRSIIKKENPQMSNQEVVAEISRRWGVMTMDDKEVYTKKSAAAKRRYEEEK